MRILVIGHSVRVKRVGGSEEFSSDSPFDGMLISPDFAARAVLNAIEQPPEVEIDKIVLRPTAQDF